VFIIASALVDLASCEEHLAEVALPAQSVAEYEWGELLRETKTGLDFVGGDEIARDEANFIDRAATRAYVVDERTSAG
jgi:hypothetical protein